VAVALAHLLNQVMIGPQPPALVAVGLPPLQTNNHPFNPLNHSAKAGPKQGAPQWEHDPIER